MSTTETYAPVPSALPAPRRSADVFDFIHAKPPALTSKDRITIRETGSPEVLSIRIEKSDGRCMRREVLAQRWNDSGYRASMIQSMCLLMA